jgi:hypothetical protein
MIHSCPKESRTRAMAIELVRERADHLRTRGHGTIHVRLRVGAHQTQIDRGAAERFGRSIDSRVVSATLAFQRRLRTFRRRRDCERR